MSKLLKRFDLGVERPLTLLDLRCRDKLTLLDFDVEVTYESTISMLKPLTLLDFDVE